MGKIHKVAGDRHEATLSPALSDFIKKTLNVPLPHLQSHLESFPQLWPFPRGDLYHWIPVLNRFDVILELFIKEYALDKGPQTRKFSNVLLKTEDDKSQNESQQQAYDAEPGEDMPGIKNGFPEGDRHLIESILKFTVLLLSNCGNRSLYASSERLNELLNTTSLSLLKSTLQVSLLLAKRYFSSKQRLSTVGGSALLSSHYNINLDHVRRLAAPFFTPSAPTRPTSAKGKEKAGHRLSRTSTIGASDFKVHGSDLVAIVKGDVEESMWRQWGEVSMSFYNAQDGSNDLQRYPEAEPAGSPVTPSIRRTSNLALQSTPRSSGPAPVDPTSPSYRRRGSDQTAVSASQSGSSNLLVDFEQLTSEDSEHLLQRILEDHKVPENCLYELLQKVRIAKALSSSKANRCDMVAIRLLAVANLAYVEADATFQQKISQQDSEHPRRLQLAYQLAELVQPSDEGASAVPLDLQTIALGTLESLGKQKSRAIDMYTALSANVNHGILFYVVRKAVAQLAIEESTPSMEEEEWREALFSLLNSLPQSVPRAGEAMMSAGLLDILIEILGLRTTKAERYHWRALQFLDQFVYSVRDGYQTLANAKGLDVIKELTSFTVTTSFSLAQAGNGMPPQFQAPVTDYKIPFFQQLTLRWLFKFINHLMTHNGANFGRQMRNLIDSPEILDSLRQVLGSADVYGSNVWAGAVTILTSFIHNEPTSYSVIAESRLGESFLEAITKGSSTSEKGKDIGNGATGLLPVGEAIIAVPQAFQALCLNEAGMKLVRESGALAHFFRIFESPAHIKAMDQDPELPSQLGSAFDELVRHQPTLKPETLTAVQEMVTRVGQLCHERAIKDGFGAKLWSTGQDGKLYVAGGRDALRGHGDIDGKDSQVNGDVNMMRDEAPQQESATEMSMDEVVQNKSSQNGPYPTAYLTVATRFLVGFLTNSTMCAAFIDNGGLEYALDFATTPCLPFSFDAMACGFLQDELGRMIQYLVEQKPHIVLPAVIKRVEGALDDLQPLLQHNVSSAFFAPFTSTSSDESSKQSAAVIADGTSYAKALVIVNVLCSALSAAFGNQMFSPRAQSNIFTQVNLADVYISLIDRLGKLHRSCIWEETLLVKDLPPKWDRQTQITSIGFGTDEADNVLRIVHSDAQDGSPTSALLNGALTRPGPDPANEPASTDDQSEFHTMQFENTRVIRYLLFQAPFEISRFFHSLGRMLLVRRTTDAYQKQNAMKVADQLAASAIEWLQFQPACSAAAKDRDKYWIVILTSICRLMMDEHYDRPTPQTVTLILNSFKNQEGFAVMDGVLNIFFEEVKAMIATSDDSAPQGDFAALMALIMGGIKVILDFYSRVINSRYVIDATQTTAMVSRNSDRERFDYFSGAQLLVELRMAVIKQAQKMWGESESAFMDKATTSIVKSLIEILRIELEGEAEAGAVTRTERLPRRKQSEPRKWTVKSQEVLDRLTDDFGRDLAMEALFRCYDSTTNAREYCKVMKDHTRSKRTFIPQDEVLSPNRSRSSPRRPGSSTPGPSEPQPSGESAFSSSLLLGVENNMADEEMAQILARAADGLRDTSPSGSTRNTEIPTMDAATLARMFSEPSRDVSSSPAQEDRVEAGKLPMVTVDDLNDERAKLRQTLIDRCLDVLNVHDDVTFELSDLISAAVSKAPSSGNLRQEIGSTLLMSLTSLQPSEDLSDAEARQHSKKIASYAHLLALVLQDKAFYEAVRDELHDNDNFSQLVDFIKIRPEQKMQDTSTFIGQVLLILERLLTDDTTPQQIEYKLPNPDADIIEKHPIAELQPPFISFDEKSQLFNAILEVLPHIGKDESLALSVTRALVILTRNRQLALKLGEKQNIRRLFSMVKQLHGVSNEKLQGAFLLVLRHIIEDDDTVRNIMRSEIQAMFENRSARQLDTTSYTRNLHHLVIRNPQLFIEVTNEKVTLLSYNHKHAPQTLMLKKDPAADTVPANKPAEAAENGEKSSEPNDTDGNEKIAVEKQKPVELKMPVVEHPDGVIHFILGELLNYKDVEDPEPVVATTEKAKESTQADVEMTNAAASLSAIDASAAEPQQKKPEKAEFKAENHPHYIYRCFLLQCLTELLSCYNRTKVEFINFKRKADPQGTTPSKPRSFVLNYLLNNLIPTGTLSHADDIAARKRSNTSSWAMSVVVSLCSKTGEGGYTRPPRDLKDYEEEPELLFVRKFVLEHAIRSFRDAQSITSENLEQKYSRLLNLADLFNRMLTGKPNAGNSSNNVNVEMLMISQRMLAKIMYEKNFISALTGSIADVDLNFPGAKRAVKYILRPLKLLTQTANDLSLHSDIAIAPGSTDEDEISSDSAVSDIDDTREETPDLFRNSALGILDPTRDEDTDSDSDDDDDEDEEMYEDGYVGEEMEYDDDMPTHDHDDIISDEEQEIAEIGPVEGLPGDVGIEIMGMDIEEDDGDDMTDSEDDEDDMDDDDDLDEDAEDMADLDDVEEGEGGSIGADDEDWGTEADLEDYAGQDDIDDDQDVSGMQHLDDIVRVLEGDGPQALLQRLDEGDFDGDLPHEHEYIEDEMPEEEDEDDEDEYEEEDIAFQPEMDGLLARLRHLRQLQRLIIADDDEIEMRGMPWGGWEGDAHHAPRHHHHHHHIHTHAGRHGHPWGLFTHGGDRMFPPTYRSHRPVGGQRATDDGTNPLLQRQGRNPSLPTGRRRGEAMSDLVAGFDMTRLPRRISPNDGPVSFISNLINMMTQGGGPAIHHHGGTIHLHIAPGLPFPGGMIPREFEQILRSSGGRRSAEVSSRTSRDDPTQAVSFVPTLTTNRWQEEARLLFGQNPQEKSIRVINSILRLLVPPAIEAQKRREQEETEQRQKAKEEREAAVKAKEEAERKEREEREAQEKKEKEEREATEAAARAREQVESSTNVITTAVETDQMEGIEQTQSTEAPAAADTGPSEPTQRITTTIDGQAVDITHLGIDPEYLEALPEDIRREVLMEQTLQQRSQAAASGQEPSEISPEFLEALPRNLREELLQQEAIERRRREREEARRRTATSGSAPVARADDMDPATFFATLDPQLRAQLLMEVDEESLNTLTPELQAEARALIGHRRLDHYVDMPRMIARGRGLERDAQGNEQPEKRKPTPYVQILDKAGVATLLRLMFIPQQGSAKQSLNGILRDVCHNKQNRAEVVSILLSILQDGSNDINAVERSFAHLSLRAKQPSAQKTPQPKRTSPELTPGVGEMSPLMVVQQCLSTLEFLTQYNLRIAEFFLTEHETGTGFKPRSARKGKGKENKASKYPINALLGLLDRKLVIESAPVMEQLASLLQRITHPLVLLLKKDKEKEKSEEEQKNDESTRAAPESTEGQTAGNQRDEQTGAPPDVEMISAPEEPVAQPLTTGSSEAAQLSAEMISESKPKDKSADENDDKAKKHRTLSPPEVPESNLRLIINIIAARECPSKTFKDTLSLITNLSTIPEAKEIFGQELIHQAQGLGQSILNDLEELSVQISKATSGTDVQGMALAKFSPASSDQAKLLRVITALDFLFDPKRADTQDKPATSSIEGMESQQKEDILTTLYENSTFGALWNKLSECLTAIRRRGNMFNVANILLPLIEVLMVVCKNTTLKDVPIAKASQKEFALSSPEPESREARMENLFFTFTEEHRKVLNDLVRHNPKLMSGSFSLLVKNSKVLEFDNKRNFFHRKLHARSNELRQPHPSLQLQVRRDQVFLDSFKSLYYKKPDEFKYGKLSIRFTGEEGVDAGGVTREWFQVLTKQMFDPNYALFNPVASDRTTFHPNPESGINEQHLTFFKFIGRIIGKALYESRVLDCHFSRAVYKRILGRPISIKDMESLDPEYYKSLQWILDHDITDIIEETFCVQTEAFGEKKTIDLIEDGRNVPVTEENKQDYVRLVVEHKLIGSVKEQLEHFLTGFHDIVPADLISIFNEQELELLISGLPDIDVDDWKNNTEYHNYQASSPQIQWFWRAIRSFDKEERAKLLQFVTGTSKVPLNGFKELEGMNGFSRFNIHRDYGSKDRLPSSHTCFNQLDLPEYDSYEDLRKNLYIAMTAGSEYFGFA